MGNGESVVPAERSPEVGKWPKCPDCSLTLIYVTAKDIRAFSCACGYTRKMPGFLEQLGIVESDVDMEDREEGC